MHWNWYGIGTALSVFISWSILYRVPSAAKLPHGGQGTQPYLSGGGRTYPAGGIQSGQLIIQIGGGSRGQGFWHPQGIVYQRTVENMKHSSFRSLFFIYIWRTIWTYKSANTFNFNSKTLWSFQPVLIFKISVVRKNCVSINSRTWVWAFTSMYTHTFYRV